MQDFRRFALSDGQPREGDAQNGGSFGYIVHGLRRTARFPPTDGLQMNAYQGRNRHLCEPERLPNGPEACRELNVGHASPESYGR